MKWKNARNANVVATLEENGFTTKPRKLVGYIHFQSAVFVELCQTDIQKPQQSSNGKYNDVLQNCIVTKITIVRTEEHVMKMSIINIIATVSLALPANTAKQVSSSVAMLM